MVSEARISPKHLAQVLGVPGYLFSDLPYVQGTRLQNGWVQVNDPATPAINGTLLDGEVAVLTALFIPSRELFGANGH